MKNKKTWIIGLILLIFFCSQSSVLATNIIVSKTAKREIFVNESLTVTINIKNFEDKELNVSVKEIISAEPIEPKDLIVCPNPTGEYVMELQPCYFLWNFVLKPLSSEDIYYKITSFSPGKIFIGSTELHLESGEVIYSNPLVISVKEISYVCGNNICETNLGENSDNCPQDCPASKPEKTHYIYYIILAIIILSILIFFIRKIKVVK